MPEHEDSSVSTAPPIEPGPLPTAVAGWPRTLAVLSMVLGGLGVLWHGCQGAWGFVGQAFIRGMMSGPGGTGPGVPNVNTLMDAMRPWVVCAAALSLVCSGLSAWLLYAGVMLYRRRKVGVRLHVPWAWARLVTVVMAMVLTVVTQVASAQAMTAMMKGSGAGGGGPPVGAMSGVMIGFGVVGALLYGAVGAAYPVVVLCVMRRERVVAATADWAA